MAACPTHDALPHLAARVSGDPFFLAAFLARSGLGAAELARRLGVAPAVLPRLALCATPRSAAQFEAVAARFGADPGELRRLCAGG